MMLEGLSDIKILSSIISIYIRLYNELMIIQNGLIAGRRVFLPLS